MSADKKDLLRADFSRGNKAVLVIEEGLFPIIKAVFLDGRELVIPVNARTTLELGADELTTLTFTIVPGDIEVITEKEMKDRIAN